jgi:hypothetical protein
MVVISPNGPNTLAEVASIASDADAMSFAVRNFLDAFYADPVQTRLEEEPQILREILADDGLADAYLAGIAHHLAQQFQIKRPAWADSPVRVMKTPWFSMSSHAGRMFLLTDSPAAFRQRNIFINADALTRV